MHNQPHLFIAVNYKSVGDVRRFVSSLKAQRSGNWRLVIKDNSEDESETVALQAIVDSCDGVSLFSSNTNAGYFPGAQEVLKSLGWNRYATVTVCNVDLELAKDNFVDLLDGLDSLGPDIMVVAPDIYAVNKNVRQNPFMVKRPTTLSVLRRRVMFATRSTTSASLRLYPFLVGVKKKIGEFSGTGKFASRPVSREIYAPHGAFMTFRPSYFALGNDFDHPTVLFGEELTVGENVMQSGGRVIFIPDLRVDHRENSSMGERKSDFVLDAFVASGKYGMSLYNPFHSRHVASGAR